MGNMGLEIKIRFQWRNQQSRCANLELIEPKPYIYCRFSNLFCIPHNYDFWDLNVDILDLYIKH